MDVVLLGPMPTPAVAMLTRSMRADLGVMISASHNPFHDNGIKLFGPDGFKLSATRTSWRSRRCSNSTPSLSTPNRIGRAKRIEDARGRYVHFAKSTFPDKLRLDGLKIVIDCANGAAYHVAPEALWELGAEVIPLGVQPNGTNINDQCGSTHPKLLQETVVASGADIGLALDGDADRLIVVDDKGKVIDGDQLMALIALDQQRAGPAARRRRGGDGDEQSRARAASGRRAGFGCIRTKVGDRYVLEAMRESGCNVGGEQSGHIILTDHATTGDGLVAGLQMLAAMVEAGSPGERSARASSSRCRSCSRMSASTAGAPLEADGGQGAHRRRPRRELDGRGRLVIRKSGTEPLIRVMAEGDDAAEVETVVARICAAVEEAAA